MSPVPETPPTTRPERRGCAGIFFVLMLILGAGWGAALGVFVHILEDAQSTIDALEEFRPKIGSKVYSFDGELLGELTEEERRLVRLSDMPLHLQMAFIATEDDKYYQHRGVRIDAIANAFLTSLQSGRKMRGGSTITQQVVRNVEDLNIGQERSIRRKLREAIVALQVEREFTKDEVLELYLNQIFLGISAWGVEAASHQYFGKSCTDLTLGEAATLAGLTRAPNSQNPLRNFEAAVERRDIVLGQMLENQFITEEEYQAGLAEDLGTSLVSPEAHRQLRQQGESVWAPHRFKAPYFSEEIRQFVYNQYEGEEKKKVREEGLDIRTSLDMRLQEIGERVLEEHLAAFDERKLAQLTKQGKEEEFVPVSGALVCIDNRDPYKGFVRAMVGGRDWEKEKYNTATQAKRQPGSSIKPFVWAAAIADGMTPSTIIVDAPFVRASGSGSVWAPKNFDGKFNGPLPIRRALEKSINIVSIKLTEKVGTAAVRSILERCGITTPVDPTAGLTIALGSSEVKVIDHCVAFSTFANNGTRYDPVLVTEIRDRDGLLRYDYKDYQRPEQALLPPVAYVVTHMLQGAATRGTGASGTKPLGTRPRAGKTGTSNDARDVWFCGFTTDYTCVVWVGYRGNNRSLGSGRNYTGGKIAAPIWADFMIEAEESLPEREFEVPEGVDFFDIDPNTGVRGGSYKEAYVRGTAPPSYTQPEPKSPPAAPPVDMKLLEDL